MLTTSWPSVFLPAVPQHWASVGFWSKDVTTTVVSGPPSAASQQRKTKQHGGTSQCSTLLPFLECKTYQAQVSDALQRLRTGVGSPGGHAASALCYGCVLLQRAAATRGASASPPAATARRGAAAAAGAAAAGAAAAPVPLTLVLLPRPCLAVGQLEIE